MTIELIQGMLTFCFNAKRVKIIPILVANHIVASLVNMTSDDAIEMVNPYCTSK